MKNLLYAFCMLLSSITFAQVADDGLVTSKLNVGKSQPFINSFVASFQKGMNNAKSGVYKSFDDISSREGYDVTKQLTMEQYASASNSRLPLPFVIKLQDIINSIGTVYNTLAQLRQALANLASERTLSANEATMLAAFDLSVQVIGQSTGLNNAVDGSVAQYRRLPGWLRCTLGILGGGLGGFLSGAVSGSVVPAIGTAIGGAIGAISGAIAGALEHC